jgi:dihydrofolate reductase
MKKLIVKEWITLDGVFDANTMNIWNAPFHSDSRARCIIEDILGADAFLYGRTTYEMLAPYWSSLKNNEMGVADKLNSAPKYVVSTTLKKAGWNNSHIVGGNAVEEVKKLKQGEGNYILLDGSAMLAGHLMKADLVDEYRFLVHPVIMGRGKKFFGEDFPISRLKLVHSEQLDLGVIQLVYEKAVA